MCGITILKDGSADVLRIFLKTWIYQETRGTDACGVFALGRMNGRDAIFYSKYPVQCSVFVPYIADVWRRHSFVPVHALAHARAATHGSPLINRNNHPIVRKDDYGVVHTLVHNGIVHMRACSTKRTETDSEEILCAFMSSHDIKDVYRSVVGSASVGYMAVADGPELRRFVVMRYISPLSRLEQSGAVIYASVFPREFAKQAHDVDYGIYDLLTGRSHVDKHRHDYHYYYWSVNTSYIGECIKACAEDVVKRHCEDYRFYNTIMTCKRDGVTQYYTYTERGTIVNEEVDKTVRSCYSACVEYDV